MVLILVLLLLVLMSPSLLLFLKLPVLLLVFWHAVQVGTGGSAGFPCFEGVLAGVGLRGTARDPNGRHVERRDEASSGFHVLRVCERACACRRVCFCARQLEICVYGVCSRRQQYAQARDGR